MTTHKHKNWTVITSRYLYSANNLNFEKQVYGNTFIRFKMETKSNLSVWNNIRIRERKKSLND